MCFDKCNGFRRCWLKKLNLVKPWLANNLRYIIDERIDKKAEKLYNIYQKSVLFQGTIFSSYAT